jgi:hypothetical protein
VYLLSLLTEEAMIILRGKTVSLNDVIEFTSSGNAFELTDIVSTNDLRSNYSNFDQKPGYFVYQTKIFADQSKIDSLGITGIKFDVSTTDPSRESINIVESFDIKFESATDTLQKTSDSTSTSSSRTKLPANSLREVLYRGDTDFGKKISVATDTTKSFRGSPKNVANVLKTTGRDPAVAAAQGRFTATSPSNAISLDSRAVAPVNDDAKMTSSRKQRAPSNSLSSLRNSLRANSRGSQDNELVRALTQNENQSVGETRSSVSSFNFLPIKREYTHSVEIDKEAVFGAEKLFVRISPIMGSNSSFIMSTIQVSINHGNEVSEFFMNPEPPSLTIVNAGSSSVKINVTRHDPTLEKIRVHRIISNPYLQIPAHEDVADIEFQNLLSDDKGKFAADTIQFYDSVDNTHPNLVSYRFCVINKDGSVGKFSGVSIQSVKKHTDILNSSASLASIRALNTENGVTIRVKLLQNNILAFRLLRQEFKKSGVFSESVVVIPNTNGEKTTLVKNNAQAFDNFVDTSTVIGRKYRYFLAYYGGTDGSLSLSEERISDEDELLIRRYPTVDIPFVFSIKNANAEQNSVGGIDVSFDVDVRATKDLFNVVNSALLQAGLGQEFIQSLSQDTTKAKQFLVFLIERLDTQTGRREELGFTAAGTFYDNASLRSSRQISELIPGREYEYIAKACLQQPEVFLQSSSIGVPSASGEIFQKKSARFARFIYNRMGVMPADSDIRNGISIDKLLLEAQLGIELSTSVIIPNIVPKINNLPFVKKMGYTKIRWSAENSKFISYFQIFGKTQDETGIGSLLGAVACPNQSEIFSFEDDRHVNELGRIVYDIRAICYNDDVLLSTENSLDLEDSNVPRNFLMGYVYDDTVGRSGITFVNSMEDLMKTQDDQLISSKRMPGTPTHAQITVDSSAADFWKTIELPSFSGRATRNTPMLSTRSTRQNVTEGEYSAKGFADMATQKQTISFMKSGMSRVKMSDDANIENI